MKHSEVDAVIVGAGGGGGVVAFELSKAGLKVVLLERGHMPSFPETGHDELRSQRTTVLGNAFGPDDERHSRLVKLGDDKQFRRVLPSEGDYGNTAAVVGGGTLSYGAMAWRFLPQDFRMKSIYGAPQGSSLEDWPISYDDLEPFYERAEWEIGVSGKAGANKYEAPRKKVYPMPPLPYNLEAQVLLPAAKQLGWSPFPIPMAINSKPYNGKPACIGCPHCVGFRCEADAKNSTATTLIPRAIATGNCELRINCVAKEVLLDGKGRASSVVYFSGDKLEEQPAKLVVIAASATETARLLLNSKSKLFPKGLANNNDWVGRNLQGHAYTGAIGLFRKETFDGLGPAARIATCKFNHGNPGIRGGGMLANEFIRMPYLFARGWRRRSTPRWGLAHKQFMREAYQRSAGVKGPVQEMPVFTNRVEVDESVRDHWGIPVARITGKRHPEDIVTAKYMADRAQQWLKAAGAVETWTTLPGKGTTGGQHQAGTCRMGDDPKTSVVNRYCQAHTVDNLFIADGSPLVTNGGFNPSLTIQAVALWASDYMVRHWRSTKFR